MKNEELLKEVTQRIRWWHAKEIDGSSITTSEDLAKEIISLVRSSKLKLSLQQAFREGRREGVKQNG